MIASRLLWLHCWSPVHNGSGEGLGTIDRPIIREVTTSYPFIQGSSIKGVLRSNAKPPSGTDTGDWIAAFGPEPRDTQEGKGALSIHDAQIAFFPVRSLKGTWVWVTCPLVLARLSRLFQIVGAEDEETWYRVLIESRLSIEGRQVMTPEHSDQIVLEPHKVMCLEDVALQPAENKEPWSDAMGELLKSLASTLFPEEEDPMRRRFLSHVAIVTDDQFLGFVTRGTSVEANIEIGPTGVTTTGSLRYTEYLPAESILVALVAIDQTVFSLEQADIILSKSPLNDVNSPVIRVGADQTTGKGLVHPVLQNRVSQ